MISDVTREIHHIEIDELGKMSIVTDRLIYQRAVDKAGCCVDYSKSPVVDRQCPVHGRVEGYDGQVRRAVMRERSNNITKIVTIILPEITTPQKD